MRKAKVNPSLARRTKVPRGQNGRVFPGPADDPIRFSREDWTEFRDITRISARAGVRQKDLPKVAVKELVDNGLDAGRTVRFGLLGAEKPGEVRFFVGDDGPGLP